MSSSFEPSFCSADSTRARNRAPLDSGCAVLPLPAGPLQSRRWKGLDGAALRQRGSAAATRVARSASSIMQQPSRVRSMSPRKCCSATSAGSTGASVAALRLAQRHPRREGQRRQTRGSVAQNSQAITAIILTTFEIHDTDGRSAISLSTAPLKHTKPHHQTHQPSNVRRRRGP